ncbi:MAG: hypothetical protein ACHREM_00510 [Polyangiales bacterium]
MSWTKVIAFDEQGARRSPSDFVSPLGVTCDFDEYGLALFPPAMKGHRSAAAAEVRLSDGALRYHDTHVIVRRYNGSDARSAVVWYGHTHGATPPRGQVLLAGLIGDDDADLDDTVHEWAVRRFCGKVDGIYDFPHGNDRFIDNERWIEEIPDQLRWVFALGIGRHMRSFVERSLASVDILAENERLRDEIRKVKVTIGMESDASAADFLNRADRLHELFEAVERVVPMMQHSKAGEV